jgi:hypothetical protein
MIFAEKTRGARSGSSFGLAGTCTHHPNRCIREIETHEVCPGWETAPGFFHVRDPPSRAS